jgi:hypothetical protein
MAGDEVRTSWPRTLAVALAVAVIVFGLTILVVALPLFGFARMVEPGRGVGRPGIRTGLVRIAVPLAFVVSGVAAAATGRWYRRGGRLPTV